jgi:hypothetical protein
MNWRTLCRLCLVAVIVATSGMAGADYDIDVPDNLQRILIWQTVDCNGTVDVLGADVDVQFYDGGGYVGEQTVLVPAMNPQWTCSWNPVPWKTTDVWETGTGAVVLYKVGEDIIQDSVDLDIRDMP